MSIKPFPSLILPQREHLAIAVSCVPFSQEFPLRIEPHSISGSRAQLWTDRDSH
jgi:hypothetical protein